MLSKLVIVLLMWGLSFMTTTGIASAPPHIQQAQTSVTPKQLYPNMTQERVETWWFESDLEPLPTGQGELKGLQGPILLAV